MSFKNKIVLVTGANRGIGLAIADIFVAQQAIVIGTSTSESGADKISTYLGNSGRGMKLNVSDLISIEAVLKIIQSEFGDTDILVNNAGITRDNIIMRMKKDEWQSVLDTNLTSVFHMSRMVIRGMLKKRYGRIITIGSVIGAIGNIGQTNYAAAKAGLIGLSKSLALEVASRGITVNVIAPGFIATEMTEILIDKHKKEILSKIPANRLGYPREIASAVSFLASNEAAYITGETIHVNGGMYMP